METVFTAGHSTRPLEKLVELLRDAGVTALVDVRRTPFSRRNPQYNRDSLARGLAEAGIAYRHEEALGGRRAPPGTDSPNTAWSSEAFRAYADHLGNGEARSALEGILERAATERICLLCAEIEPGRCHRWILADALALRGAEVRHLLEPGSGTVHQPHPAARLSPEGVPIYPGDADEQGELFGPFSQLRPQ